jgi:ABC-type lipoprotein export system ATPase subunit
VHALVGQNGSGKSTLIKVLAGFHQPDPGARAWVNGSEIRLGDGEAAIAAGVRFVHQDLGLVGMLNAVENIALTAGYITGAGRHIRWRAEQQRTREALAAIGRRPTSTSRPASRRCRPRSARAIAIARALIGWEDGAQLLILDEPTATLPGADVKRLFEVDPPPQGARRLDPVRVAPPRRGVRARRPCHRAARRQPRHHHRGAATRPRRTRRAHRRPPHRRGDGVEQGGGRRSRCSRCAA